MRSAKKFLDREFESHTGLTTGQPSGEAGVSQMESQAPIARSSASSAPFLRVDNQRFSTSRGPPPTLRTSSRFCFVLAPAARALADDLRDLRRRLVCLRPRRAGARFHDRHHHRDLRRPHREQAGRYVDC